MRKMNRVLICGVAAVSLGLLGCGGDDTNNTPGDGGIARDKGLITGLESGVDPGADGGGAWDSGGSTSDLAVYPTKTVCMPICNTVADCPQGALDCQNKTCIFCTSDAQCVQYGGAQKCDVATGSCIMCEQDSHCVYMMQPMWSGKCDTQLKLCVACAADADCLWQNSTTTKCVNNRCAQCTSDADCAGQYLTGCETNSGFCMICKSDAECCPPEQPACGLSCDLPTGACLCQSAQQCSDVYGEGAWECTQPF